MGMRDVVRGLVQRDVQWRERARLWLSWHRLPADDAAVGFVAERLRARRRGLAVSVLVALGIVGLSWWGWGLDGRAGWVAVVTAWVACDTARRRLVWHRWDRRMIAARSVRVTTLSEPTWDDLVGRRALHRAAVLLGAALAVAVAGYPLSGALAAGVAAFLVVAAAVHAGALLEVARRRPMPAGDELALAVNDRLRGEEAREGAGQGLSLLVFVPLVVSGQHVVLLAALSVLLCGGLAYVSAGARHRYAYELVEGELVAR